MPLVWRQAYLCKTLTCPPKRIAFLPIVIDYRFENTYMDGRKFSAQRRGSISSLQHKIQTLSWKFQNQRFCQIIKIFSSSFAKSKGKSLSLSLSLTHTHTLSLILSLSYTHKSCLPSFNPNDESFNVENTYGSWFIERSYTMKIITQKNCSKLLLTHLSPSLSPFNHSVSLTKSFLHYQNSNPSHKTNFYPIEEAKTLIRLYASGERCGKEGGCVDGESVRDVGASGGDRENCVSRIEESGHVQGFDTALLVLDRTCLRDGIVDKTWKGMSRTTYLERTM